MADDLLDFPCRVPVKVFVRNTAELREAALSIVRAHFAIGQEDVTERLSREGRYLSLTVTVHAQTREQIDALYQDLSAHDSIMMAL